MKQHILMDFDSKKCSGCLACVNACPSKALYKSNDEYGFIIPAIDEDACVHCGLCMEVCPYQTDKRKNQPIVAYAALNKNEISVKDSSSGGIFNLLAKKIIEQQGCVCGAAWDEDFQVKHVLVEDVQALKRLQKSKYVQSDTGQLFSQIKQVLLQGRKVLFSGTPCQVEGLKSFLKKDYENLTCVDLVCHGVPNQKLFDDYLKCLSRKVGKITNYTFRAKKQAKNGMNWFFSYQVKGKKPVIKNWPEDSYNYMYMKNMTYRDSCYECKFATKSRISDITLCDYWSWDKYHLKDFESSSTVSGVIINTEKGKRLWSEISNEVVVAETKYDDLALHNKCLISSSKKSDARDGVLEMWKKEGYEKIDSDFMKNRKVQILKYRLMRLIPENVSWKIAQARKN